MNENSGGDASRRAFLKDAGRIAAVSALAGVGIPRVHAAGDDVIRLALVGCGGRGTGAAENALSVPDGRLRIVALADLFPKRLETSVTYMKENFGERFDAPPERRFIGFDAYRQAMDCLRPGDIVILTTPPAFRWVHFTYAIEKGLHVFMEKPVTVDGPTTRRMLELGKASVKKNLKVGVGLMCRHCDARQELRDRIRSGAIGDILTLRAYRMHGPIVYFLSPPKPEGITETMYQIQRFHSFLWSGGGCFSDFNIHNIDECCMIKDAWPVRAQASGGRHYRGDSLDQNFDNYSVEYTFADGSKFFFYGRCIDGALGQFASYAHGSKGSAVISSEGHHPAKCRIYKGQDLTRKEDVVWAFGRPEPNPYETEWIKLIDAIRRDQPHNEVERGAIASLVTSMGRMAAHTGQVVTYDQILNSDHEFAPGLDKLTMDSPAPLQMEPGGRYPLPMPGRKTREY